MLASCFMKARTSSLVTLDPLSAKGDNVGLEAKRLVRERPDCYDLGNNSALILRSMQVQRPANRIGREKSELLDGSHIAGKHRKIVQRLIENSDLQTRPDNQRQGGANQLL
jgi:hypothetical protein